MIHMAIEFNSFKSKMDRKTPEGILMQTEGNLAIENLVSRYKAQAVRDLSKQGSQWDGLVRDIRRSLTALTSDTIREDVASSIAQNHKKFLNTEKSIDDKREQAAYILAFAEALNEHSDMKEAA